MPLGLRISAELSQERRFHADLVEVERHHATVEHADDDALAEHGGQDADAQVHLMTADVQLDAPVLRQTALGDVEIGHDLDAAGDSHRQVARGRHHLVEHAVAAIAHLVLVLERLEVDVAGLVLDRQQEHHVDELADGSGVLDLHQAVQVDGRFVFALAQLRMGFELLNEVEDRLFLAGIIPGDGLGDGLGRGDHGFDLGDAEQVAQVVEGGEVAGIGHRHGQHLVFHRQGQDVVDRGHGFRHQAQNVAVGLYFTQVDDF